MKKIALLIALMLIILSTQVTLAAPPAQTGEGQDYTVQAGDWLSKIAEKYYGDLLAYPAIVEATNAKAAEDSSYATITNPDIIEVGQKVWVPLAAETTTTAPPSPPEPPMAVGIYKAMLPAASSPGIDSTLYLNIDNTVRLVEDYLNDEAPVVQVGDWASEADQVTVNLTGSEAQAFDAPIELSFVLADNILATAPDEDHYGSAGRRYLRFDALATGDLPVPYNSAEAADLLAAGLNGIYKGFSPAATCCGLDWTLYLNPDNSANLKLDYLNGEATISQTGTWTASETGLAVMLDGAGSPDTYTIAGGALVSEQYTIFGEAPLQLYRFEAIVRILQN
jgi:uncharacterized lipoprotein NlpE involved in copper resistance